MAVEVRLISSLEKVFWDEELTAPEMAAASALRGERFSFQAAFRLFDEEAEGGEENLLAAASVSSPLAGQVELREVGQVPVFHPVQREHDADYLRTAPGLFPDPLYPHRGEFSLASGQWRCLWVTVEIPADTPAGIIPLELELRRTDAPAELLARAVFRLQVIGAVLPEQTLIHTEWFHADCLASYYQVSVFSEEHWALMRAYIAHAARNGVNLLLTPVFTPPLDTAVGGERPTVQLVDVIREGEAYRFGFDRLDRFMTMAEECGIHQFEISHLFTQWGAKAAPKIMGTVDGSLRQLFGWETDAGSTVYREFLQSFLRALKAHLRKQERLERCWFHLSDEPALTMLDSYRRAWESVRDELADCRVMDALSDYTFYEQGLVRNPIPSNDHIETFLAQGVEHLWTYYCCGQGIDVSNRFIAMPSRRNRILGWQLYVYRIEGFLQWGYNFWYSQLSRGPVNPFQETGARDFVPAGDAYLVYPGEDGMPISSVREAVFFEALQDMRALQLLEALTSRDEVEALVHREGQLTFHSYPRETQSLLTLREEVNRRISQAIL